MSSSYPLSRLLASLWFGATSLACSYDYEGAIRCDNGVRDGDETGVDCGGSCVSGSAGRCGYGLGCKLASDCDENLSVCELERCTPKKLTAKWRKLTTPTKLKPRLGAGVTFYGTAGVLVGGFHKVAGGPAGTSIQDSWIFFDKKWAPEPMAAPGRYYHAQAFDPVLKSVLIAGGESTPDGRLADTWARNADNDWTKLPDLPESRVSAAMVYDEPRQRMLFYGEGDAAEVWVRASTPVAKWERLKTTNAPQVPFRHAMAYDAARDRVVVFGGATDATYEPNQQTSLLDPASLEWQKLAFSVGPRARWGSGMAYDSLRRRIVLFAGRAAKGNDSSAYDDTWEWDGSAWAQLETLPEAPKPPRVFHPAFAYDPGGRQMIAVVGGTSGFDSVDPAETWALAVLGWPCASNQDCGAETFCVQSLCCNSSCEAGVCNDRDQPGVCQETP